ncbi:VOC family protein [Streptosporangium sp. NPDC023615]|uniref:VOC family protein n=1 Tax=Streptosporangium sp. NPDC023615 TaxID=3154794 RepID=UPI003412965B
MPRRLSYGPGTPCWVDHVTVDPTGAKRFYGDLFGWEFVKENGRGYHLITLRGEIIGGLGPSPMGPAFGSSWNVYLASKDLARTREEVGRLGGRVLVGPVPAGGDGRLCLAVDATGAAVGFWEGGRDEGVVLVDEPGALCAAELHTPAPDAAEEFYRNLYGGTTPVIRSSPRGAWVPFFGAGDPAPDRADRTDQADRADRTDRADRMDRVTRAARAAGARPLGDGLFADPLGAVFGLAAALSSGGSVSSVTGTGTATDPATGPAAGSIAPRIGG